MKAWTWLYEMVVLLLMSDYDEPANQGDAVGMEAVSQNVYHQQYGRQGEDVTHIQ